MQWQIVKRVAELDAIFAYLYGLNTEDLRYILDPKDICGKGCINETFRVLKDNEIRQYGEYRTKRLVLEVLKTEDIHPPKTGISVHFSGSLV